MDMKEQDQKRWIEQDVEGVWTSLSPEEQRHILGRLNAAEAFERFLNTKYVGQKRYGLEGAESAIPLLDAALDEAAKEGMTDAVLGIGHRGRLNTLINILGKNYSELLAQVQDLEPASTQS